MSLCGCWSYSLGSTEKLVRKMLTVFLGQGTTGTGDRSSVHRGGLKLSVSGLAH